MGVELFHADRRTESETDGADLTKPIIAFSDCAIAANKAKTMLKRMLSLTYISL